MLQLCYCFNTVPDIPDSTVLTLTTAEEIRSAFRKIKTMKWPTGGYTLVIKPPRHTPLMAFGRVEFTDELERFSRDYRRKPNFDIRLAYRLNFDSVAAPETPITAPNDYPTFTHAADDIEVSFPAFSIFDKEKEMVGTYLCEFFDSIAVYTPEFSHAISDVTESMDNHFRDLRKWVKRASDLNNIFMVTTALVKPLSGKDGKLAMVYQLTDRYNRRYVIRMPAKPVSNRDLPAIAMEHNLPNLINEIVTAPCPHLYLPWGYWFNELPELA